MCYGFGSLSKLFVYCCGFTGFIVGFWKFSVCSRFCQISSLQIPSPICSQSFHPLDSIFHRANIFNFLIFFIYLAVQVLVAACGISHSSMQTPSCSMWSLAPQPGIKPGSLHRQCSLSHWVTREVPKYF